MTRTAFQIAFGLALVVWTVLLVRPTPPDVTADLKGINHLLPYLVAKALHLSAYAVFAGWALTAFGRRRWWAFGAVAVHTVLGELGQYLGNVWFATGRTGCVTDVLIDATGMGIGAAAWWACRRRAARSQPEPTSGAV